MFVHIWVFVLIRLSLAHPQPIPQIRFLSSNEFNFGSNLNSPNVTKIGEGTFLVPKGMSGSVLVCTAPYPITWTFHNAHFIGHASWMISLRTRRTAKNIYDLRTYEYMAMVNIYGNYNRLSGNYTCSHAARPSLRSSIYIFWQDDSRQTFIQANESITVYSEDNMAVLPCVSANPDFRDPVLKKLGDENVTQLVPYNSSVRFGRRRGIILDNVPFITGNYICTPGGPNPGSEYMNVQVKRRNESNDGWLRPVKSNASISWDPATSKVKCCSSTRRSPIVMHYYCNHPSMCEFWKKFVAPNVYNTYLRKKSRKGCTSVKLYVHSGGIVHCVGDGIDSFRQYAFGLRNWALPQNQQKTDAYFDWSEINPHDMMLIQLNTPYYYLRPRYPPGSSAALMASTVYSGQVLMFYCYVSEYYFSEGIRWAIKWKNNTLQIRDQVMSYGSNYRYEYSNNNFQISAHVDMEAVMCIAPVWNSTEYIHKPFPLYVNVSSKPVLNDTIEEFYTWTMNDTKKEISCSAYGIPIPTFNWQKLDDWWHPTHMNLNHTQEFDAGRNHTKERIHFDRVSYTTNGTYVCTASNFGGNVIRKIHIFVEEPASYKKAVAIIVGIVLSIILLAAVLLISWKLRSEKRLIYQLSSAVTFKDGNIRPEPPEPFEPLPAVVGTTPARTSVPSVQDYSNTSLDPSKLSANLID